jgi:hypothetical protein
MRLFDEAAEASFDQGLHRRTLDAAPEEKREAFRSALEAALKPGEPVITGAIYDFAGFLTTRDAVIKVGSAANAAPVAELVKEWCQLRGLDYGDAFVQDWQNRLSTPAQTPPRLTDDEKDALALDVMGFAVLDRKQAETARMLQDGIESAVRHQFGVDE